MGLAVDSPGTRGDEAGLGLANGPTFNLGEVTIIVPLLPRKVVTLNVVIGPVVWAGAMVALNEATTQAKKIERTPSFIYYRPGFASGDEGGSRVSLVQNGVEQI